MNAFWSYFWPCFAAGLVVGGLAGSIGFRRRSRRNRALAMGAAVAIALAALWHGPLGGAARFETVVQRGIQQTLVHYEMTQVSAHLHHGPLTRRVVLSGPADDFQQRGLAEFMNQIPGVSSSTWTNTAGVPMIVEAMGVAVLGFLFGLLLAYVAELRRRYNSQWNW
ncbi:MAG TPA: hypothetical protein VF750_07910 [Sphingomicrobium sp.]